MSATVILGALAEHLLQAKGRTLVVRADMEPRLGLERQSALAAVLNAVARGHPELLGGLPACAFVRVVLDEGEGLTRPVGLSPAHTLAELWYQGREVQTGAVPGIAKDQSDALRQVLEVAATRLTVGENDRLAECWRLNRGLRVLVRVSELDVPPRALYERAERLLREIAGHVGESPPALSYRPGS